MAPRNEVRHHAPSARTAAILQPQHDFCTASASLPDSCPIDRQDCVAAPGATAAGLDLVQTF